LVEIPGVTHYGISDPARFDQCAPTVAFTLDRYTPRQAAERLSQEGVSIWDGNDCALAVTERFGVAESCSIVQVGITDFNTIEEVDRLLAVVNELARL
jgi:selenocysteine lyase/cysteine desulfurase